MLAVEAAHLRRPRAAAGQEGVARPVPPVIQASPGSHFSCPRGSRCVMFSPALPAMLLLMCIFLSFQPQDPGTVDDC